VLNRVLHPYLVRKSCERLLQVRTDVRTGPKGPWKTVEDVDLATLGWVHLHNTNRLHGYLDDLPPAEFEAIFYATKRTDQHLVDWRDHRHEEGFGLAYGLVGGMKEGQMPSETAREVVPIRGATPGGQRGPGRWVANKPRPWEDMTGIAAYNLPSGGRSWRRMSGPQGKPIGRCTTHLPSNTTGDESWSSRRGARQTVGARGVCGSALKLPHRRAGLFSDKRRTEPRSEPDSGNPTVRDRRAALRNVACHASGVLVRALNFEPDNRTHGLKGGRGKAH
jgi:hypothetical protein